MRRIHSFLIVHSDPRVVKPLASALRARRCIVGTGAGVQAALRLVATVRFDAVAVAAQLPDGPGSDLLDALRAALPSVGLLRLGGSEPSGSAFLDVDEPYDAGHLLRLAEMAAAEAALALSERMLRRTALRH
jgi:ActR/RegA family two-component response regulator